MGIDIGSATIKVSMQNSQNQIEEVVWEGGEREILNVITFLNSRTIGTVVNTKAENLPQIVFSVNNFIANNMDQTF